jgi:hypothetical protein
MAMISGVLIGAGCGVVLRAGVVGRGRDSRRREANQAVK